VAPLQQHLACAAPRRFPSPRHRPCPRVPRSSSSTRAPAPGQLQFSEVEKNPKHSQRHRLYFVFKSLEKFSGCWVRFSHHGLSPSYWESGLHRCLGIGATFRHPIPLPSCCRRNFLAGMEPGRGVPLREWLRGPAAAVGWGDIPTPQQSPTLLLSRIASGSHALGTPSYGGASGPPFPASLFRHPNSESPVLCPEPPLRSQPTPISAVGKAQARREPLQPRAASPGEAGIGGESLRLPAGTLTDTSPPELDAAREVLDLT